MKIIVGIFSIMVILSCGKKEVLPQQYLQYFNDINNGLIKTFSDDEIKLTVQYRTQLYEDIVNENELKDLTVKDDSLVFFMVEFQSIKGGNILEKNLLSDFYVEQRIDYLRYKINKDFKLVLNNQDTQPCVVHHWERNYDIKNSTSLFLVFENKYANTNQTLIYNDNLFNLGQLLFRYTLTDLKSIPSIKL